MNITGIIALIIIIGVSICVNALIVTFAQKRICGYLIESIEDTLVSIMKINDAIKKTKQEIADLKSDSSKKDKEIEALKKRLDKLESIKDK